MARCTGCMAADLVGVVESDYGETLDFVKRNDGAWNRYQEADEFIQTETGTSIIDVLKRSVDTVIEGVTVSLPASDRARHAHLHSVFMEMDSSLASCQIFSDGSGLVRVGTGLNTLCEHLNSLNSVWLRGANSKFDQALLQRKIEIDANAGRAIIDGTLAACVAALRYYLIHQRVWGLSAKVVPTEESSVPETASVGWYAFQFIVAHEVSHFRLNHASDATDQPVDIVASHEVEFAADIHAFELLMENIGHDDYAQQGALLAAQLALLVVAVSDAALYVRPPTSHPSFTQRSGRLRQRIQFGEPSQSGAIMLAIAGVARVVEVAADFSTALPASHWESLVNSTDYDTSAHPAAYFRMIQAIDRYASFSWEQTIVEVRRLQSIGLPNFEPGLRCVADGDLDEALRRWRVKKSERILNNNKMLAYHTLVDALASCGLYDDAHEISNDRDTVRILLAALCACRIEQGYREGKFN